MGQPNTKTAAKRKTQYGGSKLAAIKLKSAGSCANRFGPVLGLWTTQRCKRKSEQVGALSCENRTEIAAITRQLEPRKQQWKRHLVGFFFPRTLLPARIDLSLWEAIQGSFDQRRLAKVSIAPHDRFTGSWSGLATIVCTKNQCK